MRDETRDFSSLIPHASSLLCGFRLHFSNDFQMGIFHRPFIIRQAGRVGNVHIVLEQTVNKTNLVVANFGGIGLVYQFFISAFLVPMMMSTFSAKPMR